MAITIIGRKTATGTPLSWATIPTVQFAQGSAGSWSIRQYLSGDGAATATITILGALPSGITFNGTSLVYNGTGPAASQTGLVARAGGSTDSNLFTASIVQQASGFAPASGFTVEGSFADGGTITITRSSGGFGSKPNGAKPMYFWDWSGGVVDTDALSRNVYSAAGWTSSLGLTQDSVAPNSTHSFEYKLAGTTQSHPASPYPELTANNPSRKFYYFKKFRSNFTGADASGQNSSWNLKWSRFYYEPSNQSLPYFDAGGGQHATHLNIRASFSSGSGITKYYGGPAPAILGDTNWRTEELAIKLSSTNDDYTAGWHSYTEGRRFTVGFDGTMASHVSGGGEALPTYDYRKLSIMREQNDWALNTWRIYHDCWYVDDSWCRVLMSDESEWSDDHSAQRYRELCVPTSWSDTSITCVIRQGSFANLSGKTLYVVTNDNTPLKVGVFQ